MVSSGLGRLRASICFGPFGKRPEKDLFACFSYICTALGLRYFWADLSTVFSKLFEHVDG